MLLALVPGQCVEATLVRRGGWRLDGPRRGPPHSSASGQHRPAPAATDFSRVVVANGGMSNMKSGFLLLSLVLLVCLLAMVATPTRPEASTDGGCLSNPDAHQSLTDIRHLLSQIRSGGGVATDAEVVDFLQTFHRLQTACHGDKQFPQLKHELIELTFPMIAFGITGHTFAQSLAANGQVQELVVFGQPRPPELRFGVPMIVTFRHPEGHSIVGSIETLINTAQPVRQVFTSQLRDGTVVVQSHSGAHAIVGLPPDGVSYFEIAVAPIGVADIPASLVMQQQMRPLLAPQAWKPPHCVPAGFFCPRCPRHTVDCAILEPHQDCWPSASSVCYGFWVEDDACHCVLPFTDPPDGGEPLSCPAVES